jgi:cytochrome oxidase Cu insertion factor (SCO1/SenC/PrrC family)
VSAVGAGGCCGPPEHPPRPGHVATDENPATVAQLALLDERHPAHAGRGTNAVHRTRADVLLALAAHATPEVVAALLPHLREELALGRDPLLVAAAARATAALGTADPGLVRPGLPRPELLLTALDNVRDTDDLVQLNDSHGTTDMSTAATELLGALAVVGMPAPVRESLQALAAEPFAIPRAARSALARALGAPPPAAAPDPLPDPAPVTSPPDNPALRADMLAHTTFQDQDGEELSAAELFGAVPTVVVFFYTRCENPLKCSLTISTLARLQGARAGRSGPAFRTVAITYDPAWDVPSRLRAYGADRGMTFNSGDRLVRTTAGADALDAYLRPGVGYGPVTVNRHRAELYVLDASARITAVRTRARWAPEDALALVREAAGNEPPYPKRL